MSVKVHEAFCFDSFQDRLLFFDDFHGDQVQDEWRYAGSGAGNSGVVIDQETGGIIRLTTGNATGNNARIDWGSIRTLLVLNKISMEVRAKLNQTANTYILLELLFDANNQIAFIYDTAAAHVNWYIRTMDGGAGGNQDTGIAPDTNYHIFRIECFPTGEVHFYIDGTETGNSPITTNIPDDATDYLEPFLRVLTRENAQKSMDIDYIYIRQER